MVPDSVRLGSKLVGPLGFGMMGLTWVDPPPSKSQSLDTMKAAFEAGATFWNGGHFYGTADFNSTHLIHDYFAAHPEQADKVVLSIKATAGFQGPDNSETNIRQSVEDCLRVIKGVKTIDIFECARIDQRVPVEENMRVLEALRKEGKIGAIGLSEVSADTIRRAVAVAPVVAVEVELSLIATDILYNGIAATCGELDIPIVAWGALGRGAFTTKHVSRHADIPDGDHRKYNPKFHDEVLQQNNKLVHAVEKLAHNKGCTNPQVALAWLLRLSNSTLPNGTKLGVIIPLPGASKPERVQENTTVVDLSDEEMRQIWEIIDTNPVVGDRFPPHLQKFSEY